MKNALLTLTALAGLAAAGALTSASAATASPAPVTVQQSAALENVGYGCGWRCRHRRDEWRRAEWRRHHGY